MSAHKHWVLVIQDGDRSPRVIPLAEGLLSIGRASDSSLQLASRGVSRNHATLDTRGAIPVLTDRNSTNGTTLGGHKIRGSCSLQSGDVFQLGEAKIRIVDVDAASGTAALESPDPTAAGTLPFPHGSGLYLVSNDGKQDDVGQGNHAVRDRDDGKTAQHGERETFTPWYRRGKTLIIGAGALAGAVLGVLNLWDRVFPQDTEDVARIESVSIIKQTSLADFASEGLGKDIFLHPTPEAEGQFLHTDIALVAETLDGGFVWKDESLGQAKAPTEQDAETGPASIAPSPTAPENGASTPPSTQGSGISKPSQISDRFADVVAQNPAMTRFDERASRGAVKALGSASMDKEGNLLPPEEAAAELADTLVEVEAIEKPTGVDPIGWTVAVSLSLEGLKHVPLVLTWSLDGVNISDSWQADNLAYRIVATTPRDSGVAKIWVPNLKKSGQYNVNVELTYETNGTTAALKSQELPQ